MKTPPDLLDPLRALWRARQEEIDARWNRTLPLADYVVDRWEKAKILGFGRETSIYDSALVFGKVSVGDHCWIGPHTILDGSGGLEIGSYVSISAGVHIYTHDTVRWALSGGREPYQYSPTRIGSRCYIGPHAMISRGVTIGDGCVIGAHSFVDKSIPAGSRAWGVPARVVGPSEQFDV